MEQQELPIEREREWGRGGRWGMEKTEEERKQSSGTYVTITKDLAFMLSEF